MADFDPLLRRETWLFQVNPAPNRAPKSYKRLRYNFVEYDGSPDRYVEPMSPHVDVFIDDMAVAPSSTVYRMEYFDSPPASDGEILHQFD